MSTYQPEGRLSDPNMELHTDPRINPKMLKALAAMGLDKKGPSPTLTIESPLSAVTEVMAQMDAGFQGMYDALPNDLPGDESEPKVEQSEVTIKGVDGNDIALHVFRRADTKGQVLPCVVYTHGGEFNWQMRPRPHPPQAPGSDSI